MTEYQCKAVWHDTKIEFLTYGAVTVGQAYRAFEQYTHEHNLTIDTADDVSFERVSIDD